MTTAGRDNSEVRTGAVVLAGIGLLVAGIIGLPALLPNEEIVVHVEFPLTTNVDGLNKGSKVFMGGLCIGSVKAMVLEHSAAGGETLVDVALAVDANVVVPRTAVAHVSRSLTGGAASLEIWLPRERSNQRVSSGDTIGPAETRTFLASFIGSKQAAALERAAQTIGVAQLSDEARDLNERLSTTANEVRGLSSTIRADWTEWEPTITALLAAKDQAVERVQAMNALFGENQPLDWQRLQAVIEKTKQNWQDAATVLSTLKMRVNDQVIPPISDLIDRIKRTNAVIKDDVGRIQGLSTETAAALERASADLAIAGDQVARISQEVTLMPWTLLGGAFEDKSEAAQFQKFAREIVRSAAELHMAVIMAQTLLETDPQLAQRHPELVALLKKWIDQASTEHEAAGTMLLNQLIGPPAP